MCDSGVLLVILVIEIDSVLSLLHEYSIVLLFKNLKFILYKNINWSISEL